MKVTALLQNTHAILMIQSGSVLDKIGSQSTQWGSQRKFDAISVYFIGSAVKVVTDRHTDGTNHITLTVDAVLSVLQLPSSCDLECLLCEKLG